MKTNLLVATLIVALAKSATAATFLVNNADDPGNGICDLIGCTLREAIDAANANPGADTIAFNIPGTGVYTITPATALPVIQALLTIDGYTQPGASENTLAAGNNAVLLIELDGSLAGPLAIGLNVNGDQCLIRGLVINGFGNTGINLNGLFSIIEGNFIGTDPTGNMDRGNGLRGVSITNARGSTVGGTSPAARNVISGNGDSGVVIFCCDDTSNLIAGNYIGTNRDGTVALPNDKDGININSTSVGNLVGGADPGAGNLISGNTRNGIYITDGGGGVAGGENVIQGNLIGTNATGSLPVGNKENGIFIENADNNQIGGTDAGAGNVISGNGSVSSTISSHGILILGSGTSGNQIQGNLIGTNSSGTSAVSNLADGVHLLQAAATTIGGTTAAERNVISGNLWNGVELSTDFAQDNLIMGNYIGTDLTGSVAIGNKMTGVSLNGAQANTIGGSGPGAGNVISGNDAGVTIFGLGAGNNRVQANLIGTDASGTAPLGNMNDGVVCGVFSTYTLVGGPSGLGNVIAYNRFGVRVAGSTSIGHNIFGNSIFANEELGIDLIGGSQGANSVTANDFPDTDTGPNELQNFPALNAITVSGEDRAVEGELASNANTDYVLNFYCNSEVDPSGYGEGETWLGSLDVHTNSQSTVNFTFPLPASARGKFITATATDPAGNTSEFSIASEIVAPLNRFLNISTRLKVQTGDNVLIGGFIIDGTDAKEVIVRAIGPSLGDFGVTDPLANPILELHYPDGTTVVTNNNWRDDQEAEIMATGLAPNNDLESAIFATLDPGLYTAIVRGVNAGTGVALVETYDLSSGGDSALANISTRGLVETGDNVMIGGIIVGPDQAPTGSILLRGIGPSLGTFGVPNPLADPMLELRDGNGALMMANDNWKSTQQGAIEATGLAPSDDMEAAILADLLAGPYTAILSGVGGTSGIGLVEAYHLD